MTRDTPLSDIGLSPRALKAMYDHDCRTVGDLSNPGAPMDTWKGMGPASLKVVRGALDSIAKQDAVAERARQEHVRPRCGICRHRTNGECHRDSPRFVEIQFQRMPKDPRAGVWPTVADGDICGQFEAGSAKDNMGAV